LFWLLFLAPISGFSWFLFLPCCWFIVSDSIWHWIISSYLWSESWIFWVSLICYCRFLQYLPLSQPDLGYL
jgi:hypothetical protein